MHILMTALMAWAAVYTGLPIPVSTPNVVLVDRCDIPRMFFNDPSFPCSESMIEALYEFETQTIYLPNTWSPVDFRDVSVLLHELVHHMQGMAGVRDATQCAARDIEKPAYDAQIAFIEAAGAPGFETIGINPLAYMMLTHCASPP